MINLTDSAKLRLRDFYVREIGRDPEYSELTACIDALDSAWDNELERGRMELSGLVTLSGRPAIFEIDSDDVEV